MSIPFAVPRGRPQPNGAAAVLVASGLCFAVLLGGAPDASAQCETELIPAVHGPQFGSAVGLSDKHLVVGDVAALGSGRAYAYDHTQLGWLPVQTLTASPGPTAGFGHDVDVDGDRLVVGAADENGGVGAVYVFERVGNAWVQTARLTSADQLVNDFGSSVAIRGDWIVVGAWEDNTFGQLTGAVYAFESVGGAWVQQDKLFSSDAAAFDVFGFSLDLDPPYLIVGAPSADSTAINAGAAYVFELIVGSWVEVTRLAPVELEATDLFGQSVTVSGTTAMVGAHLDDDADVNAGAVYVYEPQGPVWTLEQKLVASDGEFLDQYGIALDLENDRAAIGASSESSGVGAVYIVERFGDTWFETSRLTGSAGSATLGFGNAVAVHSGQAAVGADTPFVGQGAVYLFGGVAPWDDLGGGVEGVNGFPTLEVDGTLCTGDTLSVQLDNAFPTSPAALIIGTSALQAPFMGGVLWPSLDSVIGLFTDTNGRISLSGPWPAFPPAVDLYLQYWITDPAGQNPFSATNAVRATTP